jgi:hypothetical protein
MQPPHKKPPEVLDRPQNSLLKSEQLGYVPKPAAQGAARKHAKQGEADDADAEL